MPIKEGWRYEIIDGELYVSTTPSWQHQYICTRFITELETWNRQTNLGVVLPAIGVIFADDDNVAPDVIWISHERLAAFAGAAGHIYGAPEIMIEVLSPGRMNQLRDREAKLDLYGPPQVRAQNRRLLLVRKLNHPDHLPPRTQSQFPLTTGPQIPYPLRCPPWRNQITLPLVG